MVKDVKWVSNTNTLELTRNNGITTLEGICELIDNSIDARAKNISISLEEVKNQEYTYTITDDGCGIPTLEPDPDDPDGEQFQGIRYALMVGGKMNVYGNKKIGRFGWGLSSTVSELTNRTEVYSKSENDEDWRYSFYDYNYLKENELTIPEEKLQTPPLIDYPNEGTVIRMHVKPAKKMRLKPLQQKLLKRIGTFYSEMLSADLNVIVSVKNLKGPWTPIKIDPNDYLWKDPKSRNVIEYGTSSHKGDVEIIIDSKHSFSELVADHSVLPQTISIKLALLPVEGISKKSGIRPQTGFGEWLQLMTKLGIGDKEQGFALSRNGRIIETGKDIGYTKMAPLNFFRAVITFSEELDELFGIQNNKNKSRIYEPLEQLIGSKCASTLKQIREDHKNIVSQISVKKIVRPQETPLVERHVYKIRDILPRPKISPKERKKGVVRLKKVVELIKDEISIEGKKKIADKELRLEDAKKTGDTLLIHKEETELIEIKEQVKQDILDVEERFEHATERLVQFHPSSPKSIGTGEIYTVESFGDKALVTLNSESAFFHHVYARAAVKPWDKFLLDLMLFSMAYSEHLARSDVGSPARAKHWVENRRDISTMIHRFVEPLTEEIMDEPCAVCGESECYCEE